MPKLKGGEEIHVEQPVEAGAGPEKRAKLKRWLYGMRLETTACEEEY